MGDALASPDRNAPVTKVTYASRQKRRRESIISYKDVSSDEEGAQLPENPQSSPVKRNASTKMSTKNPSPKKVDVHLPGPSPKRPRHDASESASAKKPVSRARKGAHSRAGSVASIAREDTIDASMASPTKPTSSMKPPSMITQRTDTPEDAADDRSSIGESSKARARKTESERRQFLEEDPSSGDVEAHKVFCKACDSWVELNPKRRYIMRLWLEHKKQCKNAAVESPSKAKTSAAEKATDEAAEDDGASIAATSVADGGHRRVVKEEDRKAILEADPRISELKSDSAFCKDCQKWVRLSPNTKYSLYHWRIHTQKCTSTVPSSRVATAQRKLKIVNDANVKAFTARSVECKLCDATIELEGGSDYDLTKWEEHKLAVHNLETPVPEPRNLVVSKTTDGATPATPRPPPSTASTEETVVATDSSPPRKGTKRAREDDDDEEVAVAERSVRPRDETYTAPEGESPGFLNWFVAPVKHFFRGFREGLAGSG